VNVFIVRWQRHAIAAIAIAMTAFVHSALEPTREAGPQQIFLPDPAHAKIASLGFDTVIADYYWLQALQLVGGDKGDTRRHAGTIGEMVDLITTLDPWVEHPYRFAAVWLTDSPESVRTANRLLERGIAHHPDDWRNHYHLGFNRFFYLEDNAQAADAFEAAMALEGAPRYLGALVARLRMNAGGLEMAAGFLVELAQDAADELTRAEYLKALDEIETERRARALDAAREAYRRRKGEDIRAVADLVAGPEPILSELPPAHPHFDFPEWAIDPRSGQIVSSFYGSRYHLHLTERDERRRESWRKQSDQNSRAS
jgi:tetratricopeptide (TPR) repeat protein